MNIVEHERVVPASAAYVRLIIRRPQAYVFRARYGKLVAIPGLVILDGDGKVVGSETLSRPGADAVGRLVALLGKHAVAAKVKRAKTYY